jgi:hypothetical protein
MAEKIAVLGVYPNYSSVENAVDVLMEAGLGMGGGRDLDGDRLNGGGPDGRRD